MKNVVRLIDRLDMALVALLNSSPTKSYTIVGFIVIQQSDSLELTNTDEWFFNDNVIIMFTLHGTHISNMNVFMVSR